MLNQYTIVVPVKDEDPGVIEKLRQDTQTAFGSTVDLIVVDDGSRVPVAATSLRHAVSKGYGAALKTGIEAAQSDWVITMDGDGQHRIRDVQRLIEFTQDFPEVDMVVGDRRLKETSWKRYLGRKCLNIIASAFAWRWIPDLNSGLRIFRKTTMLGYFPILCDSFSFTTSLTLSMMMDGYGIDFLPIKVLSRIQGKSQVKLWKDGWITLKMIVTIGVALRTRRIRSFVRPVIRRMRFICH